MSSTGMKYPSSLLIHDEQLFFPCRLFTKSTKVGLIHSYAIDDRYAFFIAKLNLSDNIDLTNKNYPIIFTHDI